MTAQQSLFAAAIVGIVAILFQGIGFLKSQPNSRSARLFFAISIGIVFYVLNVLSFREVADPYRLEFSNWFEFLVDWIPSAIPPFFMMFCLSIFQEGKKIPLWLIAACVFHLALVGSLTVVYDYFPTTPEFFNQLIVRRVGNYLIDFLLLGFSLGALYWTLKDWRNDLIEGRRILRWLFVGVQGVIIVVVVISENFLGLTDDSYMFSQRITLYVIALFGFTMALLMNHFDYELLKDVIEKVGLRETAAVAGDLAIDLDTFNQQFIEQKLYRENGLTIAALASKLDLPEYRLRGLINKHLGFRNFSAMLHHYRIEDASHTLADRQQKNLPVLTIALDVGYNSITPFNTAFRDLKGLTPSEFRKKALQDQLKTAESAA